MKRIVAMRPAEPRTNDAKTMAMLYAAMLAGITVAQLFSLEKFIPLLDGFALPGSLSGRLVAILLVVSGVLALPFLLRMKLSVGMRWVSMVAGWVVAVMWLFLGIWMNVSGVPIENAGLLGASIELIPGWWLVFVALGFCIIAAWAAWGLWPSVGAPRQRRSPRSRS